MTRGGTGGNVGESHTAGPFAATVSAWVGLCHRVEAVAPEPALRLAADALLERWTEPQRCYHDKRHLERVLGTLRQLTAEQGGETSPGPVDLAALAADVVRDVRAAGPDRQIDVRTADGPLTVAADEPRLRRVVAGLVSNAVTHTPPGTPVTVRVAADGTDVVLEVADAGPGMDADQAARVFERFYRADPARGRQTGGSGLGLAVADAIVAAHGGAIDVDTAPGAGTTFRVRLPSRSPSGAQEGSGLGVGQ